MWYVARMPITPCADNRGFLDIETTGLKWEYDDILEVAFVVTDPKMRETLFEYHSLVLTPNVDRVYDKCNDFCKETHTKNGLFDELRTGRGKTEEQIGREIAAIIRIFWGGAKAVICGSNVEAFDKPFMKAYIPEAFNAFHYRTINVSSLREILRGYGAVLEREDSAKPHRALQDCRDAIQLIYKCLTELKGLEL
jgi:oligoribonuclease